MRRIISDDYYYVLYDLEDNLQCFIDSYDELKKFTNYAKKFINFYFKQNGDYIYINLKGKRYKLYRFCKEADFNQMTIYDFI